MPGDQTATHPTGTIITFTESDHQYQDDAGHIYESGTTFVRRFKPPFDPDGEILKRKAAEANVTPEALKKDWERKAAQSSHYGTRCHENAEYQFKGEYTKVHVRMTSLEERAFVLIWDYVNYLKEHLTFVATEQIVFSTKYYLTGSIDILMADHPNRTLWILDWKTNKDIRRDNPWGGKMLKPLSHLDDCNWVHYALQLGTYERIIRDEGYLEASGMAGYQIRRALLHVPHMGDSIEFIEMPDAGREIAEMIIHKLTDIPF